MRRLEKVKEFRANSTAAPTRALATYPYLFFSTPQYGSYCLCIPETSSHRRKYIPIGFLKDGEIASNSLLILPDAELHEFSILTSCVHRAWMRVVSGRLKSDYRYSGAITYNTFPWPELDQEKKGRLTATAQGILDSRDRYPEASLADLYDELTMPIDLRKAHQMNDKAVMSAYGFDPSMSESEVVEKLFKLYQKKIEEITRG